LRFLKKSLAKTPVCIPAHRGFPFHEKRKSAKEKRITPFEKKLGKNPRVHSLASGFSFSREKNSSQRKAKSHGEAALLSPQGDFLTFSTVCGRSS